MRLRSVRSERCYKILPVNSESDRLDSLVPALQLVGFQLARLYYLVSGSTADYEELF